MNEFIYIFLVLHTVFFSVVKTIWSLQWVTAAGHINAESSWGHSTFNHQLCELKMRATESRQQSAVCCKHDLHFYQQTKTLLLKKVLGVYLQNTCANDRRTSDTARLKATQQYLCEKNTPFPFFFPVFLSNLYASAKKIMNQVVSFHVW